MTNCPGRYNLYKVFCRLRRGSCRTICEMAMYLSFLFLFRGLQHTEAPPRCFMCYEGMHSSWPTIGQHWHVFQQTCRTNQDSETKLMNNDHPTNEDQVFQHLLLQTKQHWRSTVDNIVAFFFLKNLVFSNYGNAIL